mmetsp:Transcript_108728/g.313284  ORF Transcript_108728/g.313284 Transcript_108728/m.313284 type:complete len:532 (+) Transcript_108728:3-1598(+)
MLGVEGSSASGVSPPVARAPRTRTLNAMIGTTQMSLAYAAYAFAYLAAPGFVAAEPVRELSGKSLLRQLGYFPAESDPAASIVERLGFGIDNVYGKGQSSDRFDTRRFYSLQVCARSAPHSPTVISPPAYALTFEASSSAEGDAKITADFGTIALSSKPAGTVVDQYGRSTVVQRKTSDTVSIFELAQKQTTFKAEDAEHRLGHGLMLHGEHIDCEDAHSAWLKWFGNVTYDCASGHTVVLEYPTGCPRKVADGHRKVADGRRNIACYPNISILSPMRSQVLVRRPTSPYLKFFALSNKWAVGFEVANADAPGNFALGIDVDLLEMQFGRLQFGHEETVKQATEVQCIFRAFGEQRTAQHATAMQRLLGSITNKTFRCRFPPSNGYNAYSMQEQQSPYSIYIAQLQGKTRIFVNSEEVSIRSSYNRAEPGFHAFWASDASDRLYGLTAKLERFDAGEALTVNMNSFPGWHLGSSTGLQTPNGDTTNDDPQTWIRQHQSSDIGRYMFTAVCEQVQMVLPVLPAAAAAQPIAV